MTTATEQDALLLHAYLDGELDPANSLALEKRIENDPSLAAELERVGALKHALREKFAGETAPSELRRRVEAAFAPERKSRPSWRALAYCCSTGLHANGPGTGARAPKTASACRGAPSAPRLPP